MATKKEKSAAGKFETLKEEAYSLLEGILEKFGSSAGLALSPAITLYPLVTNGKVQNIRVTGRRFPGKRKIEIKAYATFGKFQAIFPVGQVTTTTDALGNFTTRIRSTQNSSGFPVILWAEVFLNGKNLTGSSVRIDKDTFTGNG